jgi:hypothetical protein
MGESVTMMIRGEVTQNPHLVQRKSARGGKKFNTAALRYWDGEKEEFGVASASFDLAKHIVSEASPGRKFVASVVTDGVFSNIRDIRFVD